MVGQELLFASGRVALYVTSSSVCLRFWIKSLEDHKSKVVWSKGACTSDDFDGLGGIVQKLKDTFHLLASHPLNRGWNSVLRRPS